MFFSCASDFGILVLNSTKHPHGWVLPKEAGGSSLPPPPEAGQRLLAPLSLSVEHVLINAADSVGGALLQTVEGTDPAFCEPEIAGLEFRSGPPTAYQKARNGISASV